MRDSIHDQNFDSILVEVKDGDETASLSISGQYLTTVTVSLDDEDIRRLMLLLQQAQRELVPNCQFTFAHTRAWCGNPHCRAS